jgi:hypothetical protein
MVFMKEARRLAFDTVSVSPHSKPFHKECCECCRITRRSSPADQFEVSVPVLLHVRLACQLHAGGGGEDPPLPGSTMDAWPPRSEDQRATSMPPASLAE